MAGLNLPVNVDTTYPDDAADATVKVHQGHHDGIHSVVNLFDTDTTNRLDGALLRWDQTAQLWKPLTGPLPVAYLPAGTRIVVDWNPDVSAWQFNGTTVTGRPGGRTDLPIEFICPTGTAQPSWLNTQRDSFVEVTYP